VNLNQEMNDAITFGSSLLAYTIFWAMQKNLVVGTDKFEKLQALTLNQIEIDELIKQDPLSVKPVQLYSMHIEDNLYLFVFSKDERGAKQVFYDAYQRFPKSVGDASSRMDFEMWTEQEGYRTFREIKDATLKFPSLALIYEQESKTVEQVEYEYYQMFGKKVRELKG